MQPRPTRVVQMGPIYLEVERGISGTLGFPQLHKDLSW